MAFPAETRIHITADSTFPDGKTVDKDTCGRVLDYYDIFEAYLVKFDGISKPLIVGKDEIERGCDNNS
jgi:hypothetical protein